MKLEAAASSVLGAAPSPGEATGNSSQGAIDMPIPQFCAGPLRSLVGFVHAVPAEAVPAFERRGFKCVVIGTNSSTGQPDLNAMDCVVLSPDAPNSVGVRAQIEPFGGLLDRDCRLYVRYAEGDRDKGLVLKALNHLQLPPSGLIETDGPIFTGKWFEGVQAPVYAPFVHVLPRTTGWDELADIIMRNPSGPSPNFDLRIEAHSEDHSEITLSPDAELLIRRAFWNCSSVRLYAKGNGLSGVGAFDAFATRAGNVVGGDWPYRFFVKLGSRIKVSREYHKYRETALEYVPYHLGPRLRMDHCVLGQTQGLIVSDYVSGAEVLRDCARQGRGVPAIGNLFNLTLVAWRRAAKSVKRSLATYFEDRFPSEIPGHRGPLIKAYGATRSLEELKQLFESASSQPILEGVVHGDLHATNVLVRLNDAVIIDLERIELSMPLLFDAASLEGGLFIDGFIDDRRNGAELLASLDSLYTASALTRGDHFCLPQEGSAWFTDSVRQIRMQATQMERAPKQYGLVLAAIMLKKACNPEDFRDPERDQDLNPAPLTREAVRALAYVLGERILVALTAPNPKGHYEEPSNPSQG
ncbi:MAG: hypothetical protein ACYCSN_13055 [Acidobacteriaceae bacterium]